MNARRPRWLLILLCLLTFFQLGAVISALQIPLETADQLSLSPSVQIMTGVTWAGLFLWSMINVWKRTRRGINYSLWLIAIFIGYSLMRLILFTDAEYDRQRIPFLLALFLIPMIIMVILRLVWVKTHDAHENGEKTYDG